MQLRRGRCSGESARGVRCSGRRDFRGNKIRRGYPGGGRISGRLALPGIAEALGVSGSDVKCWAAAENGAVRYWWTSPDGVLLMNSAAAGTAPESPADSAGGSDDEYGGDIERLFEEIGLDIRDFESLGFKGGDDEA